MHGWYYNDVFLHILIDRLFGQIFESEKGQDDS